MAGIVGLGGLLFGAEQMRAREDGLFTVLLLAWWVLTSLCGGILLLRRKRSGQTLAMICFVVMLLGVPAGTIFGAFGISWFNKGKRLLH